MQAQEKTSVATEMRSIPFFNYPALFKQREDEFMATFKEVCSRGAYILQKDLHDLEDALKKFLNVKYVFGVADGTNALILGLRAVGVGKGDEVILPSHTYIASASSVHDVGATPVPVDIGPDHMLDPAVIEAAITDKTKAIMAVQVNGRTCDMDAIKKIADKHGLLIVEDSAQALGSKFKGQSAGTFGSFGTFSFYPAKVLGCFGDGGAIVTNDDAVGEKLALLRDHGRDETGEVVEWGTNSRLDNLQAAFLNLKLKEYPQDIARRREIAQRYNDAFADIDDITVPPGPDANPDHFDVYQNYELEAGQRDELRAFLKEHGIGTIVQWAGTPIHQFKKLGFTQTLPKTDAFFEKCFMLPMNMALSDEDVTYICEKVRAFYGK